VQPYRDVLQRLFILDEVPGWKPSRNQVDLVVERDDGRVVAFEAKLSAMPREDSVKHLAWLARQIGDELLDAVIVTTGKEAYRRPDGIAVVPAALLGP
jgi:uncharacterized protein